MTNKAHSLIARVNKARANPARSLRAGEYVAAGGHPLLPVFSGGIQGFLIDGTVSKFYTDSAGTILATNGDPVGYIEDLSGNDNHFTQSTTARKPELDVTSGIKAFEFNNKTVGSNQRYIVSPCTIGDGADWSLYVVTSWRELVGVDYTQTVLIKCYTGTWPNNNGLLLYHSAGAMYQSYWDGNNNPVMAAEPALVSNPGAYLFSVKPGYRGALRAKNAGLTGWDAMNWQSGGSPGAANPFLFGDDATGYSAWPSRVCFALFIKKSLSTDEHTLIRDYIATTFGAWA